MVTQLQDVPIPEELNPLKLALDAARTAVEKASKEREELEEKVRPATLHRTQICVEHMQQALQCREHRNIPQHASTETASSGSQFNMHHKAKLAVNQTAWNA